MSDPGVHGYSHARAECSDAAIAVSPVRLPGGDSKSARGVAATPPHANAAASAPPAERCTDAASPPSSSRPEPSPSASLGMTGEVAYAIALPGGERGTRGHDFGTSLHTIMAPSANSPRHWIRPSIRRRWRLRSSSPRQCPGWTIRRHRCPPACFAAGSRAVRRPDG
jgi:hypothetical protein